MDIIEKIAEFKIAPVIVLEDSNDAIPLGKSLLEAGLPIAEVTFRSQAAAESISILRKEFPDMLVGAGTVLTIEQIKAAVESGAQFIVSPGFNPKIVDYCIEREIPIMPGVNSPTFVEWGLERGLNCLKFFPAEVSGGIKMLKAFSGPYNSVKFIPTGGVNQKNLIDYLKLENVIACGGSWIVSKDLISSTNFKEITKRTKEALELIKKL